MFRLKKSGISNISALRRVSIKHFEWTKSILDVGNYKSFHKIMLWKYCYEDPNETTIKNVEKVWKYLVYVGTFQEILEFFMGL